MRYIAILILLISLLPIAIAQSSCIDEACGEILLPVWGIGNCFEQICILGFNSNQAMLCYNELCDQSSLSSSCQTELCGGTFVNNISDANPTITSASQQNNNIVLALQIQDKKLDNLQKKVDNINNNVNNELNDLKAKTIILKEGIESLGPVIDDIEFSQGTLKESFSPKSSLSFIYIFLAVVAIGLAGFSTFNTVKINKLMKLKPEQKIRIRNYISLHSRQGYPLANIKQGLLREGWTEKQINEARKG
jgi:hypothetical protein